MMRVPYLNLMNEKIILPNKILSPVFHRETPFAQTLKRQAPSTL